MFTTGTDGLYQYGNEYYYQHFYGALPANQWRRIEVDLGAIVASVGDGVNYSSTDALYTRGVSFRMTPIRFSNSYTAVHNALLPIELAPIASVKTQTTAASGKLTASSQWLHYNHIGNVMGTTNANGAWAATYMDAFGNPLTAATVNSSGAFGSMTLGSRGITGKAYDPRASAYYFYQRWYDPKLGAFTSRDPNPPHQQLPYMFVDGNPIMAVDIDGSVVNYVSLGYTNPLQISPMPYSDLKIGSPSTSPQSRCDFNDCMENCRSHHPSIVPSWVSATGFIASALAFATGNPIAAAWSLTVRTVQLADLFGTEAGCYAGCANLL